MVVFGTYGYDILEINQVTEKPLNIVSLCSLYSLLTLFVSRDWLSLRNITFYVFLNTNVPKLIFLHTLNPSFLTLTKLGTTLF